MICMYSVILYPIEIMFNLTITPPRLQLSGPKVGQEAARVTHIPYDIH